MAQGIVFGNIAHARDGSVDGLRVVLGTIQVAGGEEIRARGVDIAPVTGGSNCPPYGVCADSDSSGRYVLLYHWPGDLVGVQMSSCRFQITCLRLRALQPVVGHASRTGGTVGLNLRSVVLSQFLPTDPSAADFLELILAVTGSFRSRWNQPPRPPAERRERPARSPRPRRGVDPSGIGPRGLDHTPSRPDPVGPRQPHHGRGYGYIRGALGLPVGGDRYTIATRIELQISR